MAKHPPCPFDEGSLWSGRPGWVTAGESAAAAGLPADPWGGWASPGGVPSRSGKQTAGEKESCPAMARHAGTVEEGLGLGGGSTTPKVKENSFWRNGNLYLRLGATGKSGRCVGGGRTHPPTGFPGFVLIPVAGRVLQEVLEEEDNSFHFCIWLNLNVPMCSKKMPASSAIPETIS